MILNLISTKLAYCTCMLQLNTGTAKAKSVFIHSSDLKTFEKKFWMYVTKYDNNK